MGTLSVIIPCLDDAAFLSACLEALGRQSRRADEVIVVDNGSSDDSVAVAEAAGVRVIREPRRGIWAATAAGFDAATGDLLARLDTDSVPPADWLERLERRMSADDRPTIVTGPGDFYGGTAPKRWLARHVYLGLYFWGLGIVLGHKPVFGSNYGMRADAWPELRTVVHRDRADLHDDFDLAWCLRPGMSVVYERTLIVGVSARPLETMGTLGRRVGMGFHTLGFEWREWPPLDRLQERRVGRVETAPDPSPEGDSPQPV
jgi:glycosyltransferase involved in cell wall biosynthesis